MTDTTPSGRTTARAAAWAFASTGAAKLITLLSLIVLARLLAPREFGLLAFAMTYIMYAETIGDLGSAEALVYWPIRREDAAQVTFIINVATGIFWTCLTFLIAPYVATFFHAPHGTEIVRALGLTFIIRYLGITHDSLAQKDLRFRARTIPEVALVAVKALLSIVLAMFGWGAWALVWGHIAGIAAWTIFLWTVVPWRPTLRIPRDLFAPMLHYGRGIVFVNLLSAVVHHADLAIVGRFLGITALGLYQVATKLPEATVTVVVRIISKVLFPTFSRLTAAGKDLAEAYLLAARYVSVITLPLVAGLVILSREIVLVALGEKWISAAPIVGALAILAGIRALATPVGDAMKGTGHARSLALLEGIRAALLIPALCVGAQWGTAAVAVASVIADGLATIIGYGFLARSIGIPLRGTLRAFAPGLLASALMASVILAIVHVLPALRPAVELALAVVVGGGTYVVALHFIDRDILQGAWNSLFARRAAVTAVEGAAR